MHCFGNLHDVDRLVDMSVKMYRSDWYEIDRPHAEKDDTFIISLRDTGVDCLWMGVEKNYANMKWAKACYESERADAIYLYNHGELSLLNHKKAMALLEQLIESCPDDYLEYCKACTLSDYCPTVKEYKAYDKYVEEYMQDWHRTDKMLGREEYFKKIVA